MSSPVDSSSTPATVANEEESIANLEADLESIDVNSVLPEELRGPVPRTLPADVKDGCLEVERKSAAQACFWAGAFCLAFWPVPFVKSLALYFLPLDYLPAIALAFWAINGWLLVFRKEFNAAADLVVHGNAGVGIVTNIRKAITGFYNGQPSDAAIFATVALKHPASSKTVLHELRSRRIAASEHLYVNPRFRVGDAIAVVWRPHQFEETLQIYDFLELTPNAALQRPRTIWNATNTVLAVCAAFALTIWASHVSIRCTPLDFNFVGSGLWPAVAAVILGVAGLVGTIFYENRARRRIAEEEKASGIESVPIGTFAKDSEPILKNPPAIVLILLATTGAGAIVAFQGAFYLNAVLDRSPTLKLPVTITGMKQITEMHILRKYTLEYRFEGDGKNRELLTTPAHLDQFEGDSGVAMIRSGAFGWPWLETIEPIPVENGAPQR